MGGEGRGEGVIKISPGKVLKRCQKLTATMVVILISIQSLYFLKVLLIRSKLQPADMIVSFEGSAGRAGAAYHLADRGFAPVVVISPADEKRLDVYDRRFRPQTPFVKIIEDQARTTFENALYTSRIIKRNRFKSVILVTSWNHMPRSYLLLKMMLVGSGVRILPYSVSTGRISQENWGRCTVGWKMVYNDMVDTWGSIVEMAVFKISGNLPITEPGKMSIIKKVKKSILFDIHPDDLAVDIIEGAGQP